LTLDVDFSTQTIEGYAKYDVSVLQNECDTLVMDTRVLEVMKADILTDTGPVNASFELTENETNKMLGSALSVKLGKTYQKEDKVQVGVHFRTTPESSAIQWLDPEQTAGKMHPYLFTQCEAIHARTLFPCQDTPNAKFTYTATVCVPEPLTALMSAIQIESHEDSFALMGKTEKKGRLFHFHQKVPIPSYLVALVVGELESRDLGPRSRVWSEPSMVDSGAFEFADTDAYLAAGEALGGEYVWGRYDLLLLPYSFPYGGMENPCLTFVTPTLLAGDRSLTDVIAHEIAHSWTGNLVTNAAWDHFWLNEGFTRFLEGKIVGRVKGKAESGFKAASGYFDLKATVDQLGHDNPYTQLVVDFSDGPDPDSVYSCIPYEKGYSFLFYLQNVVGGEDVFEPFLKAYIDRFKYQTLTSDDFKTFFLEYFRDSERDINQIDWEAWYYSRGMPPVENVYDTSLATVAYDLARKWHTSDLMGIGSCGPKDASSQDVEGWSASQLIGFLKKLKEMRGMKPLHKSITRKLNECYGFDSSRNAEVRVIWCQLCIAAEDEAILDNVSAFLTEQGRMKFLRPLYRALYASKMGKDLAVDLFSKNRASYNKIAAKMVARDLQVES